MDLLLVDDSRQAKPTRPGMGPLVSVGGFHLPGASVRPLTKALDEICERYGFPPGEEFKWSPNRGTWMAAKLVRANRHAFFTECMEAAGNHRAQACVVIEDENHKTTDGKRKGHELDVVKLFLERSHNHLWTSNTEAVLLADHPSGGRPAEAVFVASCLQTLREGTPYADLERIALVLTEDSKNTRLLQLADSIVGCTLAYVGGEGKYAPPLFENHIKPILRSERGRIGGVGLKLHADLRYANLYHWLLGDTHFHKGNVGHPIPANGHAYVNSADDPSTIESPNCVLCQEGWPEGACVRHNPSPTPDKARLRNPVPETDRPILTPRAPPSHWLSRPLLDAPDHPSNRSPSRAG